MNFNSTDFVFGKNITNYESLHNPAPPARHPCSLNRKTYEIEDENLPFDMRASEDSTPLGWNSKKPKVD